MKVETFKVVIQLVGLLLVTKELFLLPETKRGEYQGYSICDPHTILSIRSINTVVLCSRLFFVRYL